MKIFNCLKCKSLMALLALLVYSGTAFAADAPKVKIEPADLVSGFIYITMLMVIAVLVYMVFAFQSFLKQSGWESPFAGFVQDLTDTVPVEKEAVILTDHEYDGICELDNNLPPWWKYLFYATCVFAVVYLYVYHFSDMGSLQEQEYEQEMAIAEKEKQANMKLSTFNIDENNVTLLDAKGVLKGGEQFSQYCSACHGKAGEGGVGPNLTDEYWLHGGGVQNVFKTIRDGVPQKGMIPWKTQLSPVNIQELASYIISLKGTKPANAKAPQGDKYEEKAAEKTAEKAADSTSAK